MIQDSAGFLPNEMITTTNMDCTTTLNQTSSNVLRATAWFDPIARAELCVCTETLLAHCYRYLHLIWNEHMSQLSLFSTRRI